MNTAEHTVQQIANAFGEPKLGFCVSPIIGDVVDPVAVKGPLIVEQSLLQRIRLLMAYSWSEGAREELVEIHERVNGLIVANRHLALSLAAAHDEINRMRGDSKEAA